MVIYRYNDNNRRPVDKRSRTLPPLILKSFQMYKSLLELYYQLEAPNPYSGMSYNPMMMQQPQQAPPMMQQQQHQIPRSVVMPSGVGGGGMMDGNAANFSMEQVRLLRQQEQQRYAQMNVRPIDCNFLNPNDVTSIVPFTLFRKPVAAGSTGVRSSTQHKSDS